MLKNIAIFVGTFIVSCLLINSIVARTDLVPMSKSIKLTSARGSCSGEQVRAPSGKDYILTAAHCRVLENKGVITATDESGTITNVKIVAEDDASDLLLLEGMADMRGLDIAKSIAPKEEVRTFTHGRGMATYKTVGTIIQAMLINVPVGMVTDEASRIACLSHSRNSVEAVDVFFGLTAEYCVMNTIDTVTTAMIQPGSSGGMVVNSAGELVGVVSAGDGVYGYLVRLLDIQNFMSDK